MPHTEKIAIAKKHHTCTDCNAIISPKDSYKAVKLAWFKNYYDSDETGFKTLKFCKKCYDFEGPDE